MSSRSITQRYMLRGAAFGIAAAAALTMAPSAFADGDQSSVVATTIELIDATSSSIPSLEVAGTSDSLTSQPAAPEAPVLESSVSEAPVLETSAPETSAPEAPVAESTVIEIGTATSASLPEALPAVAAVAGVVSADGVGSGALSAVDVVAVAGQSSSEPTVIEIGEATSASLPTSPGDADQAAARVARSVDIPSAVPAEPMANGEQVQVSGTSASVRTSATATTSVTDPTESASTPQSDQGLVDQTKNNSGPAVSTQAPQPLPVAAVEPMSSLSNLGWAVPALAFGFLIFRMFRRSVRQH